MVMNPLVSIIIPVYNGSNYMREAIDSALAQTYPNIEIIVVNDGSCDQGATAEIARSYGEKIRYYEKENGGVSSALNRGIQEMNGEYFSWLSHDDVYEADKIEKQVSAIFENALPENTLVYCNSMQINAQSEAISFSKSVSAFSPLVLYHSCDVLTELLCGRTFNGCCLLIPRKALTESGLFNENLRFCQDAFMWYQIFMRDYSLFGIDDVLVKNRVHGGQLTQTGQTLFRKECSEMSEILVEQFVAVSTKEKNFLKLYLTSDAKHFRFKRVREIIAEGKKHKLLSSTTALKAYALCAYGKIRPYIRKLYYQLFKRVKTNV